MSYFNRRRLRRCILHARNRFGRTLALLIAAAICVAVLKTQLATPPIADAQRAKPARDPGPPCFSNLTSPAWAAITPGEHASPASVTSRYSRSQDSEDWVAYLHFFYGRRGLTVLESGAYNGVEFSNTLGFVRELGWRAVHVESGPTIRTLKVNRPESVNIHAALCDRERTVHTTTRGHSADGIAEFMAPSIKQQYHPYLIENPPIVDVLPTLRCAPLAALLRELCLRHVDWWVLDVEGAELTVLQGVDWDAVTFDVITVEADGSDKEKDAAVVTLLAQAGYAHLGQTTRNAWFVREGFVPSRAGAAVLSGPQSYWTLQGEQAVPPLAPGWSAHWAGSDKRLFYVRTEPSWQATLEAPLRDPPPS
jgi:hypothetical protein